MGAMGVDVKTLFLINVAVLLLSAAVSYYFWRQHRDNVGLLWWAFGTGICTPGILMLGIAGPEPPIPIGLTSASLIIGGFATCWQSIRRFNGRSVTTGHVALIVLVFVSAMAAAAYRVRRSTSVPPCCSSDCPSAPAWAAGKSFAATNR